MSYDYYILEDGEQKGPYTFDELTDKGLNIHSRVLSPLADSWQDACDLPEFYRYFEAKGIYFPTEDNLASFWWRLLAYMIDVVILSFVSGIIFVVIVSRGKGLDLETFDKMLTIPVKRLEMQSILSVTLIIYNSICEASPMKGSVGKRICKLVVVDVDGQGLTYPVALIRSIGKVFSIAIFYLGIISIFWSEHRQALHDYLAKTYVVKRD